MSSFSKDNRESQRSPTPTTPVQKQEPPRNEAARLATTMPVGTSQYNTDGSAGQPRVQRERAVSSSRPLSMVQTYHPSMMDVSQDTLPELQPIFTFLNSHANKLYQEGYFLKLDDQNTRLYLLILEKVPGSNQMQMADQMPIEPGPNVLPSL